ncbi:sensor histidine kinase [Accumulibacter sp.]|uniref:sensor histidine kinase n=1 Tax=Accumulibacter sp. TaxID=2053492 RepID=UPI002636BC0C|nr:sensor histidine kinase [Accumulibacter sp.]
MFGCGILIFVNQNPAATGQQALTLLIRFLGRQVLALQEVLRLFDGLPEQVAIHSPVVGDDLAIDTAISLGLICNELIADANKHAFPGGDPGRIDVRQVILVPGGWQLAVSDNGVGLPESFEMRQLSSLGLQVVQSLSAQLAPNCRSSTGTGSA